MKKSIFRICILFILFFLINSVSIFAKETSIEERVADFNMQMDINEDSSVNIKESFTIVATERMKEYIIKRSFPVEYDGRRIEIKNIKVKENGENVDFKVNRKDRNIIVNLNEKNKELSAKKYTYNIEYTVNNLIEFKKDTCRINWHLFGDSWGIPTNNYNIKIKFPNGTKINRDNFKISTLSNEFKTEKSNIPVTIDSNYIEYSDDTLIYQGTDVILEISFENEKISKVTFLDRLSNTINRNLISIIIFILSVLVFIFQMCTLKNFENKDDTTILRILLMLASNIFVFIIAILVGMNIDYNNTINYMKNVFIKFISLLVIEGGIIELTYLSIRYELFEKNKLNQIASILVVVPLIIIGIMFFSNFLADIYYNIFGYIVLIFVLIFNVYYSYNLKRKNL